MKNESNQIDNKDEVLPSALKKETDKSEGEELKPSEMDQIAGGRVFF